ncbi:hypothetical protein WG909_13945 [Peptostreptococcaceae bacterium AGR-M142]
MDNNYIKKDEGTIVSIYSPYKQVGKSTITSVLGAYYSLVLKDKKILILTNDFSCGCSSYLFKNKDQKNLISEIYTLSKTLNLDFKKFNLYTKSISANLDILDNLSDDKNLKENLNSQIKNILEVAKELYDYIFIDLDSNLKYSKEILKLSDFYLYLVNQNYNYLNTLEKELDHLKDIDTKGNIIINKFKKDYTHLNESVIRKIFKSQGISNDFFVVPSNNFIDKACMQSNLLEFLQDEFKYDSSDFLIFIDEIKDYMYFLILNGSKDNTYKGFLDFKNIFKISPNKKENTKKTS